MQVVQAVILVAMDLTGKTVPMAQMVKMEQTGLTESMAQMAIRGQQDQMVKMDRTGPTAVRHRTPC